MQKVLNDQIWKICVKVQEWPDGETSNSSRGPTLSQVSATVIIIIIDIAIVVICTDIHWWLWMIFSCRATQIWDYPSGTTRTQTWRWVLNMSMINAIALSYISAMYWILKVGFGLLWRAFFRCFPKTNCKIIFRNLVWNFSKIFRFRFGLVAWSVTKGGLKKQIFYSQADGKGGRGQPPRLWP